MPTDNSLSLKQARALALAAQGFGRPPRGAPGALQVNRMIERLGLLQIDSVNALVRSHYLPLFSRLGAYDRTLLESAAWSQGRKRTLFEYWGHEASLLPWSAYALLGWRMQRAREGQGIYRQLAQFGREQQPLIRRIVQAVREQGALGAGSLGQEGRTGSWWGWSAEKHALEWLFAAGEVTVAGRRGFERLYDLPERVVPRAVLEQPPLEAAEAQRRLMLLAADALGVATEKDLRDYYRLDARDSQARLLELLEAGELQKVQVQGWVQPAYCRGTPRIPRKVNASVLLSPFDSLIWERARTERLFDFHYRLEIYTPQHKRVYGYYVLPFLHDGRLVARLDLRAERARKRLVVHALHGEHQNLDDACLAAMADNLQAMAGWLGLADVQINCPSQDAQRLQALLRAIKAL
ncbi:crosslink repair DNA glycosylase YcaQ family protein [Pseudomonas sp. GD03944]|uniref:winged helix-turn-helix domain-containing protein n=1 Tax=Pseudomonas sp. GD03944 TaxID=2975409 RepID=UPI00244A897E|nr:crosslink repair DNA glycosylase YcaQ family protein [Pseudomonas sp. GD03944]MDH1261375.1 winged helix DNA-binding domain-containing protein [Pseudomonas sp. GD03944]